MTKKAFLCLFTIVCLIITSCSDFRTKNLYVGKYYQNENLVLVINDDLTGISYGGRYLFTEGKFNWKVKENDWIDVRYDDGWKKQGFVIPSIFRKNGRTDMILTNIWDNERQKYVLAEIGKKKRK